MKNILCLAWFVSSSLLILRKFAAAGVIATLTAATAGAFSITSVSLSPGNVIPPGVAVGMTIDIQTPTQPTWLYAPTRIASNASHFRVDVYPSSGPLDAIGSLRETVNLGTLAVGAYHYEVVLHPEFSVGWGERTNRGSFVVGPTPTLPIVSVSTPHFPEKTAEPCPVCLVAPGVFVFTRTGPTTQPLTVYLEPDGTATPGIFTNGTVTPGADYPRLPVSVTIPAGTNAARLLVLPFDDLLAEGPEIVRVRIDRPPELASLGYQFNPNASQAMVVIGDDERDAPEARLDIVEPPDGAQFALRQPIHLSALGVYTLGEIDRPVEFFANGVLIGRSSPPGLDRPTIPCLPSVHTFTWTNPPPGRHTLTARSEISLNRFVQAPPVNITVGPSPLVWIEATQPIAEETSFPFRRVAFRGQFTISRVGPTNAALCVFVLYSGTATPGTDYPAQPFLATIPADASSTTIEIVPTVDDMPESIETVVATLSHCPPDTIPPLGIPCIGNFEIDLAHRQATVFIRDDGITRTSVRLTQPANGATFESGDPIPIDAEAFDIESFVGRVEFLADGRRIGESVLNFIRPSDPGEVHTFSFVWRGADPGEHVLTAIAHNDSGGSATSAPVNIRVLPMDGLPVVTISAADAFAVERSGNGEVNTATFRLRRTGATNADLVVAYSLHGTATHGADYELLPGLVTIPRGRRSVLVTATPIDDTLPEGVETLAMQIEPRNSSDPTVPTYHIGTRGRATALIADLPWVHPPNGVRCVALPGGAMHVCFRADGPGNFVIEASQDLRRWEAFGDAVPTEGALHFVDDAASQLSHRFYRVVPAPGALEE